MKLDNSAALFNEDTPWDIKPNKLPKPPEESGHLLLSCTLFPDAGKHTCIKQHCTQCFPKTWGTAAIAFNG